jgi:hypothetical protein
MDQIVNGDVADVLEHYGVCTACGGSGRDPASGDGLCLCEKGDELRAARHERALLYSKWTRTRQ